MRGTFAVFLFVPLESHKRKTFRCCCYSYSSSYYYYRKYVVSFRKATSNLIKLVVDGKHSVKPNDFVKEFSKNLRSVYNDPCPIVFPTL
jgi:hypothetical protein